MHRRALLRAGASCPLAIAATTTGTATDREDAFGPLGRVAVDGAAEAVVGDDGDTAYLAATDGFATVDISDPAEPRVLTEQRGLEADGQRLIEVLDVAVDGDRLAVVGPANVQSEDVFHGIVVYDVSDPAAPERATDPYETGYHVHNCYLEDDRLFVVANAEDDHALVIFDIADDVEELGRWSLLEREPEWAELHWLARYAHDVSVRDGIAYLAHWNPGTYLIDVEDPTDPTFVSHVRETDPERQLERSDEDARLGLPGNDHYAAVDETGDLLAVGREAWAVEGGEPDAPGGIDLYGTSDPAAPEQFGSIDPPRADDETYGAGRWTTAHNFELRDDRLYSSWYRGGVRVHDVSDPADPVEIAAWSDRDETAFWTARVAKPGETFVASSTDLLPNADLEGALYTFPIDATDGDADDASSIPGFTAVGALGAGGVLTLEALRRRCTERS
ncbi:LVIVD repeat-containing protein [Natronococcus occultus]|uniref:LVIVD repeat-containing protein n=1 Tax=Natronococcus occultus SP4 TaxID=694430 RepID=L0K1B8_9EURY|nr:LVIVD repeat-containing protein [Natronococcus occultus]AGB37913.1 LVIVD repeat-containing protein [Natronococcus occultus SP4]